MNKSTFSLNDTAWVDFYQLQNPRQNENYTFPAIIICPGGGYQHISQRESDPLALAFLAQGYQVLLLNYTVMNKGTNYNFLSQNLEEVQAVFSLIHQNHQEWQINPEQVFLLGCSAGGHLAAWYGNSEQIHRPKGVILCYPVTSLTFGWPSDLSHFNFEIENISEYNISEKVTSSTPPTFIWHTADDEGVPIYNSLKYCDRLSKHQVPFEAHFFESGPHGVSLANRTTAPSDAYCLPSVHRWVSWASDWLERQIKN
ncbi:alpha/beta hydrolase [Lactococcus lactis]|uniref:Sugar hydrolase n=1 Tax=Lactococcus lactis subsp. lactis A12 TaxID=1137134 RepID=S6FRG8_LACLL|nr:alpha/beta hydrolase [Lactococcus lactis]CDG03642.1 Sugar hydrolase [Lactococcus lactis subsp. lactis A12]SBW29704.1 Sugar hydrolase [Lactococcus lactis subsp. lactis]